MTSHFYIFFEILSTVGAQELIFRKNYFKRRNFRGSA